MDTLIMMNLHMPENRRCYSIEIPDPNLVALVSCPILSYPCPLDDPQIEKNTFKSFFWTQIKADERGLSLKPKLLFLCFA